jgi:hypothetical protein
LPVFARFPPPEEIRRKDFTLSGLLAIVTPRRIAEIANHNQKPMNPKLPDGSQSRFQKPDYANGRWQIPPALDCLPEDRRFGFAIMLGFPLFYLHPGGWFRANLSWQKDGAFEAFVDQWGFVHCWRKLVLPATPDQPATPETIDQSFAV